MPKQSTISKKLHIKSSRWKKAYSYTCKLDWEGQFLYYRYAGWKKIDLSQVKAWELGASRTVYSKKRRSDIVVKSLSLTLHEKGRTTV